MDVKECIWIKALFWLHGRLGNHHRISKLLDQNVLDRILDVPMNISYDVFISQLITFPSACTTGKYFISRRCLFTSKVLHKVGLYHVRRTSQSLALEIRNCSSITVFIKLSFKSLVVKLGIAFPNYYGDYIHFFFILDFVRSRSFTVFFR